MEWDELLHELEKLAKRMEIDLRYEPALGRAGRGVLFGRTLIVVDAGYRVRDRAETLGLLLADLDTDPYFVPEVVRDFLERHRRPLQLPLTTERSAAAGTTPSPAAPE